MPRRAIVLLSTLLLLIALPLLAAQERTEVPTANSPSAGPEAAPVTIVEFMDFT